jgi:hypothetical protein
MANANYSILLADRRISRNGKLVDDEFNKLCILFCEDARLALAYSGPATSSAASVVWNTSDWLLETLFDIGKRIGTIADILVELTSRANAYISKINVPDRRLSILISGFVYWGSVPKASAYVLSNHEHGQDAGSNFTIRAISLVDSAVVEATGRASAVSGGTVASLRNLLSSNLSPSCVLRYAVKHLRLASSGPLAGGTIGKQCNSAIIYAEPDSLVTTTYHSNVNANRAYGANIVVTGDSAVRGYELFSSCVITGGDIKKRDLCWCGSGKVYKHCHMKKYGSVVARIPMFKQPLPCLYQVILHTARGSGKVFCVSSGYS